MTERLVKTDFPEAEGDQMCSVLIAEKSEHFSKCFFQTFSRLVKLQMVSTVL